MRCTAGLTAIIFCTARLLVLYLLCGTYRYLVCLWYIRAGIRDSDIYDVIVSYYMNFVSPEDNNNGWLVRWGSGYSLPRLFCNNACVA